MLKVTRLLFLTLILVSGFTLSSQGQIVAEDPNPPTDSSEVSADYIGGDLLWDQFDSAINGASASQRFADFSNSVLQSADDFEIPSGDSWLIDHINVRGSTQLLQPFNFADVIFYTDNSGMPGSPIIGCIYTDVPTQVTPNFSIDLPAPCLLGSGHYWVSVMAVAPFNPNGQWFWSGVNYRTLDEWQFQDPDGLIPNPCTSWGGGMTDCGVGGGFDKQFQLFGLTNAVEITERYCSTDVPLPVPPTGTSGTTVSDLSVPFSNLEDITEVTVRMFITHTFDGDLEISIESPNTTNVLLSDNNGGSGDDYGDSCGAADTTSNGRNPNSIFDDDAGTPITSGSPPFVGTFQPEGMLSDFNGEEATGTWTLIIEDIFGGDSGTLHCWCMDITRYTPLHLDPIDPAVESNVNFMSAFWAYNGSPIAFIWGFQLGSFFVNLPCGQIELGISPFQLLGITNAGFNRVADFAFYIALGGYNNPAFTQAVDLDTCRVSDVVPNIILNTNLN